MPKFADLAAQQAPAFKQAERILGDLIKAEVAEREVPSIRYQLKSARFPAYRDLAGFRFEHVAVEVALVKSLHACEFVEQAHNVVLIGSPGPGQTHLATAVGAQVVMQHHLRVRFFSTIELVNLRESVKVSSKHGQIANRLAHADLVIVDELS